jgi:DNA-nicking Smr family endonuclease
VTGDPEDGDAEIPDEFVLPLADHLDLHAFSPRDTRSVTEAYLEQAAAAGLSEVRVIHGRGIGVQREIVRSVLGTHPAVAEFFDAPPERGGWGATIVRLRGRSRDGAD